MKETKKIKPKRHPIECNDIHCVRDLVDFYNQWKKFRKVALELLRKDRIENEEEKLVVLWLVRLADAVSERDFQ